MIEKGKIMGNTYENEIEINLRDIFYEWKRRIFLILAVGILAACVCCCYITLFVTPMYTSTATILVLTQDESSATVADLQLGPEIAADYSILISSRPVLEETIENLGLDISYTQLEAELTITNPENTRLLQLSVTDADPVLARQLVNELASTASEYIGEKIDVAPPKIIEEGELPASSSNGDIMKPALLSFAGGIIVTAGIIALMTILDDAIETEEDITKYLRIPVLGNIPDRKRGLPKRGRQRRNDRKADRKGKKQ